MVLKCPVAVVTMGAGVIARRKFRRRSPAGGWVPHLVALGAEVLQPILGGDGGEVRRFERLFAVVAKGLYGFQIGSWSGSCGSRFVNRQSKRTVSIQLSQTGQTT